MLTSLSTICSIIAGYAFKGNDFNTDGYPVIKITDIQPPYASTKTCSHIDLGNYDTSKLEKYIVSRNDFVIAMTGATIGKIGRVTEGRAYINQRVAKFEASDPITKAYIYQLLLSDRFQTHINANIDSQSAQPNISANSIGRFSFDLWGLILSSFIRLHPEFRFQCLYTHIRFAVGNALFRLGDLGEQFDLRYHRVVLLGIHNDVSSSTVLSQKDRRAVLAVFQHAIVVSQVRDRLNIHINTSLCGLLILL